MDFPLVELEENMYEYEESEFLHYEMQQALM